MFSWCQGNGNKSNNDGLLIEGTENDSGKSTDMTTLVETTAAIQKTLCAIQESGKSTNQMLVETLKAMKAMNKTMEAMNKTMEKPASVASGQYYARITDLWDFELKQCCGDFNSDFRSKTRQDFVDGILQKQITADNLVVAGCEITTPPRDNTAATRNTGSSSRSASGNPSSKSSSVNSERTNQTDTGGRVSGIEHLFGGPKQSSRAHLAPPKSPVCQEFYENILPAICGPLKDFALFQELKTNYKCTEHEAKMVLVRAIANSKMNILTLPDNHAPYYDEDMDQGTLIVIPILSKDDALKWKKNKTFSVLVVADSKKTYRFCNMDHNKLPLTADKKDITLATKFVTDCICSLGFSLLNHEFDAFNNRDGRFKEKESQYAEAFKAKVNSLQTLMRLLKQNNNQVLTPKEKDNAEQLRFLKIDLGEIPNFQTPHPILLGIKAGLCLHKYASTNFYHKYENVAQGDASKGDIDLEEYVLEKGSMMLLPGCGEYEDSAAGAPDSIYL